MTPRFSSFAALAAVLLVPSAVLAKSKETVFYSFGITSADAQFPQDGLIADKAGNMYGTSLQGGEHAQGAVFIVGSNGLETVIYSFTGGATDGAEPNGGLVMDSKGNLFGTTLIGGGANEGVVYELAPNGESYTETVLYSFCAKTNCTDGATPASRVTIGKKGELFGTTQIGGAGAGAPNHGTVWRLDPPKKHGTVWKETVLYDFCNLTSCADGSGPYTAPILAQDGLLYGTAAISQTGGTLWRLTPSGSEFQILHTFGNTTSDGATPISYLTADSDGVLYGTTRQGGGANGCGTVYSFDPSGAGYDLLYAFCSQPNDAKTSYGGVTVVETKKSKTLYGNTLAGGANDGGALFSLTPPATQGNPWTEQVLYSFCAKANCADGQEPAFGAPISIQGVLYGTTISGGAHGDGTVYRYGKN